MTLGETEPLRRCTFIVKGYIQELQRFDEVQHLGFFHQWGTAELTNEIGQVIGNKTVAICENEVSGKIYEVDPNAVTFTKEGA